MLVIFKSKAAGEIIMYEDKAKPILDLLGKDVKRGIITYSETAGAIATLEQEIERRRELEAQELAEREAKQARDGDLGVRATNLPEAVTFSARVFPLLEMLRLANKKEREVVWGV